LTFQPHISTTIIALHSPGSCIHQVWKFIWLSNFDEIKGTGQTHGQMDRQTELCYRRTECNTFCGPYEGSHNKMTSIVRVIPTVWVKENPP